MSVIIPQAQTPFQPSRQPRRQFDEPSVADAVGDIADIAVGFGIDQAEHERAVAMQTARVTATEELGTLRDRYEQDPNLDGLSDRFKADVTALRDRLSADLPTQQMRDQFGLDFRQMASAQHRAIGRRQYALQRDAALAQLNSSLRTYTNAAAAAPDHDSRNSILQTAAGDIDDAKAAGWITAQDAEALTTGTFGEAISIAALESLQADPQEFLDRVDSGEFGAMDQKQLTRLTGRARSAVASEEVRQQKAAETAAKEQAALLKNDVEDAVEIIEAGLTFDSIAELMERTEGTEHEATLRATLAAAETEGNFALIDPLDQRAVIAQLEQEATQDPEDIARLNRLRAMHRKTVDSLAADPLTHVNRTGVLDLAPVSLDDPASVRARIAAAESVVTDVRTDAPQLRYFTNGERDTIKAEIESGGPDQQLALATAIVSSFGNRASVALQEVGAQDPVFHLAGQLVAQTNDIEAARTMLTGRRLARDKSGAKVSAAIRQSLRAEFTAAFPPADRARVAGLMEAADAHYASAGLSVDPDADDETLRRAYLQSIQAVSGGVTRNGQSFGGIQSVHGGPTLLPSNMTAERVEQLLDNATAEAWVAASVSGGGPLLGNHSLPDPGTRRARRAGLDDLRLLSMGGGRYLVGITRSDGTQRWLRDERSADGLYYVDLQSLLQASEQVSQ